MATAIGFLTSASGYLSLTTGENTAASGYLSTAMGLSTHRGGYVSFSTGMGSQASGYYSTAMGANTIAKAPGSFSVGFSNDASDNPSASALSPTDRIFQIGNGNDIFTRSNAVTVLRNGNTGIGPATPLAKLHVAEGSTLFSVTGDVPGSPGLPPVNGAGRRMMWYADKAAFRAGYVSGTNWDFSNVGNYSVALGLTPVHWDVLHLPQVTIAALMVAVPWLWDLVQQPMALIQFL